METIKCRTLNPIEQDTDLHGLGGFNPDIYREDLNSNTLELICIL